MSLEAQLNRFLRHNLTGQTLNQAIQKQMMGVIDLTLLDENATHSALETLKHDALEQHVAAICVHMQHLPSDWPSESVKKATVINFPHGNGTLNQCLLELNEAKDSGADEIDYVFPYQTYLSGDHKTPLSDCETIIKQCKQLKLGSKIIIETGAFSSLDLLYGLSRDLISTGCNFLKTSTGMIENGANLSSVFALLSAIADSDSSCGIKISGGIKTPAQALQYMQLATSMLQKEIDPTWFRIGTSGLLKQLIGCIG